MNLTAAIGLALAIDYSLLIISRYREEIAAGHSNEKAIALSMRHAGRAVCYSGVTVAIGVVGMVFFLMSFLRSIAFAGVAVVLLSIILSLTMVPALLTLFGDRINRKPLREAAPVEQSPLYRVARRVQRNPIAFGLPVVVLLIALGAPALGLKLGLPDERVLPKPSAAQQVGADIRAKFSDNPTGVVHIVVAPRGAADSAALARYTDELSRVDGVSGVIGPAGTFVDGKQVGPGVATMAGENNAYLTVSTTSDPYSKRARVQLDEIRAVDAPAPILIGGLAQQTRDTATGITSAFPKALAWIIVVTFVLLLLLTGSVVLPLKALILNTLSLSATFGALVWIFQDGNLGGFGTVPSGYIAATVPALVSAWHSGLSMDYEVFLLSRFREEWDASGKTARTTTPPSPSDCPARSGDHRRGRADGRRVRRGDHKPALPHAGVRSGTDSRRTHRCDSGPLHPRPRIHALVRHMELVGAVVDEAVPGQGRTSRISTTHNHDASGREMANVH